MGIMTYKIEQIKELRTKSGLSVDLCKKALIEADGDIEKAFTVLEKMSLERIVVREGNDTQKGIIKTYEHTGSRVGVLVQINCESDSVAANQEFKDFATNVAMQIASMNPSFVSAAKVSERIISFRRAIFTAQVAADSNSNKPKPQEVVDKIIDGKLKKWFADVCLLEQEYFLSESKQTIGQLCDSMSAKFGEKIVIERFTRFEVD